MLSKLLGRVKKYRPEIILDALEERIVFDATVSPGAQDGGAQTANQDQDQSDDSVTASPASGSTHASDPVVAPDAAGNIFGQDLKVILVSNALGHIEELSQAAADGTKVIVYDASEDLSAVVADLKGLVDSSGTKIGQLAFFSHGEPGIFKLTESSVFAAGTVNAHPSAWNDLGSLLNGNARIDFYGCDIGKGIDGSAFVQAVAGATGAIVWASDNTTGSGAEADWVLEVKSGESARGGLVDTAKLEGLGIVLDNSWLLNPSFETGTLTNWTTSGTVAVVSSVPGSYANWDVGASPLYPKSQYMARLDSYDTSGGDQNTPARMWQTFTYDHADKIVFTYNFVSTVRDPGYDEFGYTLWNGNQKAHPEN